MDRVVKRISIIFLACFVAAWNIPAFAYQYVHGYTRSSGTYVRPYNRSSPNGTVTDNFSYKGNLNPYTGAVGTNRYIHDRNHPITKARTAMVELATVVHRSRAKATAVPIRSYRISHKPTATPIPSVFARRHSG